ncbi:ATP-binding cassette domain-containing protein, partial [Burkholderia sp. Bp8977]
MRGISKTFPAVRALDNVSLTVYPGEIHSLMGENGAG